MLHKNPAKGSFCVFLCALLVLVSDIFVPKFVRAVNLLLTS